MPNIIMAQGLDSTGTNSLTRLVRSTVHTCVMPQSTIKGLKLRH